MTTKYFKLFLVTMASFFLIAHAVAQSTDRTLLTATLREMNTRYRKTPNLSFDLLYRYADVQKPLEYLDSLSGKMKMNGTDTWCRIDNTEFISNATHSIALFAEDNLMYLSKANVSSMTLNPVQAIDSLLSATMGVTGSITLTTTQKIVTLLFPPESIYRNVHLFINIKTGLLDKMDSQVQASQLYDPSVRDKVESKDAFVVVETVFSNYQQGKFDPRCLNSDYYVTRRGNEWVTTTSYSNYKIFIGSTELQ